MTAGTDIERPAAARKAGALLFPLLVLALSALTVLAFEARFRIASAPLIAGLGFAPGLQCWQVAGGDLVAVTPGPPAVLRLDGRRDVQVAVWRAFAPPASGRVWLRMEARGESVAGGPEPWRVARVVLYGLDGGGTALWDEPHELLGFTGSHDWQTYEAVFALPRGLREVRLAVEMPQVEGRLEVRRPEMRAAAQAPWFEPLRWALYPLWLAVALWLGCRVWRGAPERRRRLWAVAGLLVLLGLLHGPAPQGDAARPTLPGGFPVMAAPLDASEARAGPVPPSPPAAAEAPAEAATSGAEAKRRHWPALLRWLGSTFDDEIHVGLFAGGAVIAVALGLAPRLALADLLLLAVASEAAQLLSRGRSVGLEDLGANLLGLAIGSVLCWLWVRRRRA